jgi:hypothetical protein
MIRVVSVTAAGLLLVAAAPAPRPIEYRLGFEAQKSGSPVAMVEIQLAGDTDGETRFILPPGVQPAISGGRLDGGALVRHRPGAKLTLRYRTRFDGSALGEDVFAAPQGREAEPATFRWTKRPKGWGAVSDLEHGQGRTMTVDDVTRSVVMAGQDLQVAERPTPTGVVRAATLKGDPSGAEHLAQVAAPVVTAVRTYWGDETGPYLIASLPLHTRQGVVDRGDGLVLPAIATSDLELQDGVGYGHVRTWIPGRLGRTAAPVPWFADGLAGFIEDRILLRAGLITAGRAVLRLDAADQDVNFPARRGAILALKWDEEVRQKTGGKADLDDVLLHMRDHYRRFPPGQGPDVVTGLVSAVWVTAGIDVRPDIARYIDRGEPIPLPEELFGGCLQAQVTVIPAFDAGFNTAASFAAKRVVGVRPRGPAWNSGLRDGMALLAWTLPPGDTTRQIELTVRTGKGRARKIVYWPYGDADTTTRKIQLLPTMSDAGVAACGKKMAGLSS